MYQDAHLGNRDLKNSRAFILVPSSSLYASGMVCKKILSIHLDDLFLCLPNLNICNFHLYTRFCHYVSEIKQFSHFLGDKKEVLSGSLRRYNFHTQHLTFVVYEIQSLVDPDIYEKPVSSSL